jgi:hypothetical protein
MPIDDPNVVLPLAISYNERGVAGYTHTVTNGGSEEGQLLLRVGEECCNR